MAPRVKPVTSAKFLAAPLPSQLLAKVLEKVQEDGPTELPNPLTVPEGDRQT